MPRIAIAVLVVLSASTASAQTLYTFERNPVGTLTASGAVQAVSWLQNLNANYNVVGAVGSGSGPTVSGSRTVNADGATAISTVSIGMNPDLQPVMNSVEQMAIFAHARPPGSVMGVFAQAGFGTGLAYDGWVRNETPPGNSVTPFNGVDVAISWSSTLGMFGTYNILLNDTVIFIAFIDGNGGWLFDAGTGELVDFSQGLGGTLSATLFPDPGDPLDPNDRGDRVGVNGGAAFVVQSFDEFHQQDLANVEVNFSMVSSTP